MTRRRPLAPSLWDRHSRTIVGLSLGLAIVVAFPNSPVAQVIGGGLIAIGIQGLLDRWFREVARPEDKPR